MRAVSAGIGSIMLLDRERQTCASRSDAGCPKPAAGPSK
jgi:hypothetical protein